MSTKTNIIQKSSENLVQFGQQAGIMLMAAAAVAGMLELPEHGNSKIVVPTQPVFAFAGETSGEAGVNPIRREKETEESGSHSMISYNVAQRTPARSGKQ